MDGTHCVCHAQAFMELNYMSLGWPNRPFLTEIMYAMHRFVPDPNVAETKLQYQGQLNRARAMTADDAWFELHLGEWLEFKEWSNETAACSKRTRAKAKARAEAKAVANAKAKAQPKAKAKAKVKAKAKAQAKAKAKASAKGKAKAQAKGKAKGKAMAKATAQAVALNLAFAVVQAYDPDPENSPP